MVEDKFYNIPATRIISRYLFTTYKKDDSVCEIAKYLPCFI